jgi:hypothetical protein
MRKVLIAAILVAVLVALDGYANEFRFTTGAYNELREFGRLVNRFIAQGLNF